MAQTEKKPENDLHYHCKKIEKILESKIERLEKENEELKEKIE